MKSEGGSRKLEMISVLKLNVISEVNLSMNVVSEAKLREQLAAKLESSK